VKKDLENLFDAKFIYPIEIKKWLSPLVIIPKKNGSYEYVWIIAN
jgi:hypothetical protein